MRYLLRVINMFVDSCLAWFLPLWRRRGLEAASLVQRYLRHYKAQLSREQTIRLRTLLAHLRTALLFWRKSELTTLTQEVDSSIAPSLPGFRRSAWVETVESLFIITVVFLGIRTYFAQPFRIPTNSMWPSLNGIVVHPVDSFPSFPTRIWHRLALGSAYVDITADADKSITGISDHRKFILFTETTITFSDGSHVDIPAASGTVMQYLRDAGRVRETARGTTYLPYRKGDTIMRARVDAGDMVLVNRMAYHFRAPRRGETFVFDTRGINTGSSSSLREQSGGTHFIKRLCGLPGDTIGFRPPLLLVNGSVATEPGIARVESCEPPYKTPGYYALSPVLYPMAYLTASRPATLSRATPRRPWLREYLALGDNTTNSLDSRYWGPVHQFNILGPASLTLWPFTSHWGLID